MDESFRMPPYKFKTKTRWLTDWMFRCNQLGCGWGANNLGAFLDIHLKEDHDVKCKFRKGLDMCCGHLIPNKLDGIHHFLNHALRYHREAPRDVEEGLQRGALVARHAHPALHARAAVERERHEVQDAHQDAEDEEVDVERAEAEGVAAHGGGVAVR